MFDEIKEAGIKLSDEYNLFGRSMDGCQYAFIKPVKDNYPEDYERIKEFFPVLDLELKRYENIN